MRNKIKLVLILLTVVFLSSCGFSTWVPEEDYQKLAQKTTMKSFEQLNDPVLFSQRVYGYFYKKNNSSQEVIKTIGTVFYVYDWENNSIYDYSFAPDLHGAPEGLLAQMCPDENGNTDYYYFRYGNEDYYEFKREHNNYIKLPSNLRQREKFYSGIYKPDFMPFLVNTEYSTLSANKYSVSFYNPKAQTFSETVDFEVCNYIDTENKVFADPDGIFWFTVQNSSDEGYEGELQIMKMNPNQNSVEKITVQNYVSRAMHKIYFSDNDYVYMQEDLYSSESGQNHIFIIDRKTDSIIKKIPYDNDENNWICSIIPLNGHVYIFFTKNGTEENYNTKIAELNVLEETITTKLEVPEFQFKLGEYFIRQNKIYSYCENQDTQCSHLYCYNPEDNTAKELLELTISSLCNKEE